MKQRLSCILVLLVAFALTALADVTINENLVNTQVTREIDLSNHITRHKISLDLENTGAQAVDSFFISLQESQIQGPLGYIRATENNSPLNYQGPFFDENYEGTAFYRVSLSRQLGAGKSTQVKLRMVFVRSQTPFPKEIAQKDNQYMVYTDNHHFYSPYQTVSERTVVTLPSESTESFSELEPTTKEAKKITYGPYSSTSKFSESPMRIHFMSNAPVMTFLNAERTIEISNWGNLAIEEHYLLEHTGATLKGGFSRLDFQRSPLGSAPSSFRTLTAVLPRMASDIYYRDEIGNISTSAIRMSRRNMEVDFRTRYPLFGGWKSRFYIGYNLPLSRYLKVDENDSSYHILNTTFSVPFKNSVVDSMTVKIILPEGATNEHAHIPFDVEEDRSVTVTYLDISGRPTIVLHKQNVVPEHNKRFQVTYNFASVLIVREPLLLIGGFMAFFTVIILLAHLQCSLSPHDTESVSNIVEEYVELKFSRDAKYGLIEELLQNTLKTNSEAFHRSFKKAQEQLNEIAERADTLIQTVVVSNNKSAVVMREAEQKETERMEAVSRLASALEQYYKKKAKQSEVQKAEKLYDRLSEEMEGLLDSLNSF